jgi:hypothetical protein
MFIAESFPIEGNTGILFQSQIERNEADMGIFIIAAGFLVE